MVGSDNLNFDCYVIKAASKAFNKIFLEHEQVNVSNIVSKQDGSGLQYYEAANEMTLSSLSGAETHSGLSAFGS